LLARSWPPTHLPKPVPQSASRKRRNTRGPPLRAVVPRSLCVGAHWDQHGHLTVPKEADKQNSGGKRSVPATPAAQRANLLLPPESGRLRGSSPPTMVSGLYFVCGFCGFLFQDAHGWDGRLKSEELIGENPCLGLCFDPLLQTYRSLHMQK
jgi:hypothetical protein